VRLSPVFLLVGAALALVACQPTPPNECRCPDQCAATFWEFLPSDSLLFLVAPEDRPLDSVAYYYRVDSFKSPQEVYLKGFQKDKNTPPIPHAGWVQITNQYPACRAVRWNVDVQGQPTSTRRVVQYMGQKTDRYAVFYNLRVTRLP